MTDSIVFLGTGGGRHTTMYQTRCTGGMLIEHSGHMLHVDPGPGALTQMNRIRYDLGRTESVIVSHCHPDHYSDAQSVIEGITRGGWERRGHVYGSVSAVEGAKGLGPCLSKYHLGLVEGYRSVRPGDSVDIDGMTVDFTRADHSDPETVGMVFHTAGGKVGYTCDTQYSDGIAEQYRGCRVLIQNVTTPMGNEIRWHLCTDRAIDMNRIVKPELCIFIHLGVVMIERGPDSQAALCQERSGVRTIAGRDRMVLTLGDELGVSDAPVYDGDWIPDWAPRGPRTTLYSE